MSSRKKVKDLAYVLGGVPSDEQFWQLGRERIAAFKWRAFAEFTQEELMVVAYLIGAQDAARTAKAPIIFAGDTE